MSSGMDQHGNVSRKGQPFFAIAVFFCALVQRLLEWSAGYHQTEAIS